MREYDSLTELTKEEIAESCEDAADLLEGRWIQGDWSTYVYEDEDAPPITFYCVEGALAAALGLNVANAEDRERKELINCPVYKAVTDTLNLQIHEALLDSGVSEADSPREWYGEGDLPNWNDTDGRSEQEVVNLLRKTAKRVLMPDV